MPVNIVKSDVMGLKKHVKPESVQVILCSPPRWTPNSHRFKGYADWREGEKTPLGGEAFGGHYVQHTQEILAALAVYLKPDGMILWHLGDHEGVAMSDHISIGAFMMGFTVHKRAVWVRNGDYNPILRLSLSDNPFVAETDSLVYDWPESEFKHADFGCLPVQLAEWAIKTYSRPGDLILDPMAGSGTTGVAAGILQRDCILADLGYQEVQRHRCKEFMAESKRV